MSSKVHYYRQENDIWWTQTLKLNRQFQEHKKGQQGISCSWLASRICLSFTGCQGMFTPPFSKGTRTKMLTHFLHHVTLIRWTLLAQELNTRRSRAAVTSQPASCFFRDHVTGISGDGRVAGPRKPANKIKYKQLTMTVFKTIWCYELGRHLCNLKQHQSSKPQHLKHTVSTNVSLSSGKETHWGLCVKVFSQMSQLAFLWNASWKSISPLRYSLQWSFIFHNCWCLLLPLRGRCWRVYHIAKVAGCSVKFEKRYADY